jgi:HAD superfamily hydrolase (TIGR01509 family)
VTPALLVFDCDGVLVDSEPIAARCFSEALAEIGLERSPEALDAAFRGRRLADCFRIAEGWLGAPLPAGFADRLHAREVEAFARDLRPVPGVVAALDALAHLPRCVASSGAPAKIRRSLALTGLAHHFGERLYSGVAVTRGKPAPDLFLHAARDQGADPAACVVIEDSDAGIAAGLAAGMRTLAYRPDGPVPAGAEALRRMDALPALLTASPSRDAPGPC